MENNFFLPMYFYGLYPSEEQEKIDLYSRSFYTDALEFYSKKANEKGRKDIILGIRFLSSQIKHVDDSNDIIRIWDNASQLMFVREAFFRQQPNLVTEFRTEVDNILNTRNGYLINRRDKELKELREDKENSKIQIDSLIRDIGTKNKNLMNDNIKESINMISPNEIDKLAIKINFKHRDKFKSIIEILNNSAIKPQKVNSKKFTAIASIIYNTGWISKKDITFIDWLRTFNEAYRRLKIPTYKETQVKSCILDLKQRFDFLDRL